MRKSKRCWTIALIVVNVSIASLGILQVIMAVALKHTLDSSSDALKYDKKWEIILYVSSGLMSVLIAFYGICISCIYVSFFLILYASLLMFAIVLQIPVCVIAFYMYKHDESLLKESKKLIKNDKPSQGLIFLQTYLSCCGFEGFYEYRTPPDSCCRDQHNCDKVARNLFGVGCRAAMSSHVGSYGLIIGVILLLQIALGIFGIFCAFWIRRYIKKEIKKREEELCRGMSRNDAMTEKPFKRKKKHFERKTRSMNRARILMDYKDSASVKRPSDDEAGDIDEIDRKNRAHNKERKLERGPSKEWIDDFQKEERISIRSKESRIPKENISEFKDESSKTDQEGYSTKDIDEIDPISVLGTGVKEKSSTDEKPKKRRSCRRHKDNTEKETSDTNDESHHKRKKRKSSKKDKGSTTYSSSSEYYTSDDDDDDEHSGNTDGKYSSKETNGERSELSYRHSVDSPPRKSKSISSGGERYSKTSRDYSRQRSVEINNSSVEYSKSLDLNKKNVRYHETNASRSPGSSVTQTTRQSEKSYQRNSVEPSARTVGTPSGQTIVNEYPPHTTSVYSSPSTYLNYPQNIYSISKTSESQASRSLLKAASKYNIDNSSTLGSESNSKTKASLHKHIQSFLAELPSKDENERSKAHTEPNTERAKRSKLVPSRKKRASEPSPKGNVENNTRKGVVSSSRKASHRNKR